MISKPGYFFQGWIYGWIFWADPGLRVARLFDGSPCENCGQFQWVPAASAGIWMTDDVCTVVMFKASFRCDGYDLGRLP